MDVDAAAGGNIQYPLGQDTAIGHNRNNVRLQISQCSHILVRAEILRLEHGDTRCQSDFLDGRKYHFHSPSLGAVRLGIDTDHLKAVS